MTQVEEKRAQQKAWLNAWRSGDKRAGNELVKAYHGLCMKHAHKGVRMCPHLGLDEFYAVAQGGVFDAMLKFDESRSPAFSKVAEIWVSARVLEYAHRNRSAQFSVPQSRLEKLVQYRAGDIVAKAKEGGLEGNEALALAAQKLNTTTEHIVSATKIRSTNLILPTGLGGDEEGEDPAFVATEEARTSADLSQHVADICMLARFLSDKREVVDIAVERHFAEDDMPSFNSMAVSRPYSRERVRQHSVKGLEELKGAAMLLGYDAQALL